ncbi:MAG: hypothetical protein WCI64_03290 [Chlorobium sp.]
MKQQRPVQECKKRLLVVWLAGAGMLSLLLIAQSMQEEGPYLDRVSDAWGWFLPNVMPTLSLMVGVAVKEFTAVADDQRVVDSFLFNLSLWLSVGYFTLLMASISLQPLFSPNVAPLDFLKQSNLWLGPMQGIVTLALGAFFGKAEQSGKTASEQK